MSENKTPEKPGPSDEPTTPNEVKASSIALGVKDYLDSASDAAKLVRTTTIILTFTTVLLFSGFLNAFELSWMRLRLETFQNRESPNNLAFFKINELDGKIVTDRSPALLPENKTVWTTVVEAYENITGSKKEDAPIDVVEFAPDGFTVDKIKQGDTYFTAKRTDDTNVIFKIIRGTGGPQNEFTSDSEDWPKMLRNFERTITVMESNQSGMPVRIRIGGGNGKNVFFQMVGAGGDDPKITQRQDNEEVFSSVDLSYRRSRIVRLFLELKREIEHRNMIYSHKYLNLHRSVVENAYSIKVPVFGVAFDINDLGFLGGVALIIVLSMLRFSLRSYILSLRMGIKASIKYGQETDFYETLASRQLFAFPTLKDSEQTIYRRKLETFYLKKVKKKPYNANKEFDSKSHKTLRKLPYLLFVFITLVYFGIVVNDMASYDAGKNININRTTLTYVISPICLLLILLLEYWCLIKWREIYAIWNRFYKITLLTEIHRSVIANISNKKSDKRTMEQLLEVKKTLEELPMFRDEEDKNLKLLSHNRELLEKVLRKESTNTFEHLDSENKSLEEDVIRDIVSKIKDLEKPVDTEDPPDKS